MGLQLKGDDNTNNPSGSKEHNPWDVPDMEDDLLKIEEPKVVYNTVMAEAQASQKETNPWVGMVIKMLIGLLVCGLIMFTGKKIVSVVLPEGEDITKLLTQTEDAIAKELGVTFADNPTMASRVYQYSMDSVKVRGTEDLGVVYINGKQIGLHIDSNKYTIFGVQIGDGEKEVYDHTLYPYDDFSSILDTMGGKGTVYIYYNEQRNDCIVFYINNSTNRIESMTYFNDYKKVTETLDKVF